MNINCPHVHNLPELPYFTTDSSQGMFAVLVISEHSSPTTLLRRLGLCRNARNLRKIVFQQQQNLTLLMKDFRVTVYAA